METVYLSPSGIATFENCPMSYYLDRVLKVRTKESTSSVGMGSALASAMEAFLRGTVMGKFVDPVPVFQEQWREFVRGHVVRYPQNADADRLEETGKRLMEMFPEAWEAEGLTVALDGQAEPMIERKLVIDVSPGVRLTTKLDLCAFNRDWDLVLIDQKSPAQETDIRFALMGEQLTAYQVAIQAHGQALKLPDIKGVAYWELIRRMVPKKANAGKGPEIRPISTVKPRSQGAIQAYVNKVEGIAARIRNRDFPKTPRMAWNTPCTLCPYLDLCAQGRTDAYNFANEEVEAAALKAVA